MNEDMGSGPGGGAGRMRGVSTNRMPDGNCCGAPTDAPPPGEFGMNPTELYAIRHVFQVE